MVFSIFLLLSFVISVDETFVVEIQDKDSFASTIDSGNCMIMFYAPWCGHCKKFKPDFELAAKELKDEDVVFGRIDCTGDMKEICKKFEVSGYPTLKFFTDKKNKPYEGERSANGLKTFVQAHLSPAVTVSDAENLKSLKEKHNIVLVEFNKKPSSYFTKAADKFLLDYKFTQVTDESLAQQHGLKFPSIAMFRNFDEPILPYTGKDKFHAFTGWITRSSFPIFGEINEITFSKYMNRKKPIFWIAMENTDENKKKYENIIKKVYKNFSDKILFAFINKDKFKDHLDTLGFTDSFPNAILSIDKKKYRLNEENITEESIKIFINDYENDKLKPHYKSQPIPESNDEDVFVVVGKTFKKEVIENDKNVLIEFYAPWCGHCKKLEPEYNKVGEKFRSREDIVIAKMDYTANDADVNVSGFPTIYFYPANNKANPVLYDGERNFDAMAEWLNKKIESDEVIHEEL